MIMLKNPTTILNITSVDERVLVDRYDSHCFTCLSCKDNCCHYGCPVDASEAGRILEYRKELEKRIKVPSEQWFLEETEERTGFPSGQVLRTRVINNRCVFLSRIGRGCQLHIFAEEKGMDPHDIKPLICFLFPLTWDNSCLYVSEFLNELPCRNTGDLILDQLIPELKLYLGEAFVKEVKLLQAIHGRKQPVQV